MRIQSLLYATLNPPMRALLRSPFHRIASASLCLISYRGRRSGRPFTTPLSFMREGKIVRLLSSHETRWWLNFMDGPVEVEVEIAREIFHGRAVTVLEDGERLREGVRTFLTAVPRDAMIYGIKLNRERRPREEDIASAAGHVVLVEIELQE
ncbi:MAG: nitroreductase family deazaflavin-dependent oxidoreductase [bacterium]|nr:hypothetical protein [Deltaproteobacteria bacterium]MCP4906871.1 nitroreductase family deazaflavin-dependent oxidoreductase [bacterium]